jgi:hypothetical protein
MQTVTQKQSIAEIVRSKSQLKLSKNNSQKPISLTHRNHSNNKTPNLKTDDNKFRIKNISELISDIQDRKLIVM